MRSAVPIIFLASLLFVSRSAYSQEPDSIFNFVFISDTHFGITKKQFRGKQNVSSFEVNKALVAALNELPGQKFPEDDGLRAGEVIRYFAFSVNGGDIANRMEKGVQTARRSWKQYAKVYLKGLRLMAGPGSRTPQYMIPGNHEISNAIGHPKGLKPETDPSAFINIYNKMMRPEQKLSKRKFDYKIHKVHYSMDHGGVHFQFLNMWPDSAERIWMSNDLKAVPQNTPVVIFTHDEPDIEPKHLTNPVPPHGLDPKLKFENLVEQKFIGDMDRRNTDAIQNGFAAFVKEQRNIKAYFHGNYNWNQFFDYEAPDKSIKLPVFRVDSPMKGEKSADDESLLSFIVVTVDMKQRMLTARECFYNKADAQGAYKIVFGAQRTIDL